MGPWVKVESWQPPSRLDFFLTPHKEPNRNITGSPIALRRLASTFLPARDVTHKEPAYYGETALSDAAPRTASATNMVSAMPLMSTRTCIAWSAAVICLVMSQLAWF